MRYPFDAPAPGQTLQIAPELTWCRMPLPIALDHVNVYLLGPQDDTIMVDTGFNSQQGQQLTGEWLQGRKGRVLATHHHPDHIGLSAHLDAEGWPLMTHRVEWLHALAIEGSSNEHSGRRMAEFFKTYGADQATFDRHLAAGNTAIRAIHLPLTYTAINPNDTLQVGDLKFEYLIGEGHSPAMIMLHEPDQGWLFAADQILSGISPVVALFAYDNGHNPLKDFLDSISRLKSIDKDVLVFPGHGAPFYGLHERIDQLTDHHHERLEQCVELHQEGLTPFAMMQRLFGHRDLNAYGEMFAIGEVLAHLRYASLV
ncbi:MAG: MBL fold metallo-hydrolase [Gammaproteobacteria bacterium]|nr:MBL fold metallo-hydrolase [Gammaproteobacteria bacterium]